MRIPEKLRIICVTLSLYVLYNKCLKLCFNLTKNSHDFHLAKILNDTMAPLESNVLEKEAKNS
jgi:hypothetical protein